MTVILDVKDELDSNPGIYSALSNSDVATKMLIKDKSINKASMTRNEVLNEIDSAEMTSLVGDNVAKVFGVLSDTVDPFGPAVQVFKTAFGDESVTVSNLALARVKQISIVDTLNISGIEHISLVGIIAEARAI